ncbi:MULTISPECIES: hypothetical protein [unclassified Serratia (in: enterobacteria)]|uniref:hypothetical protein n=1 Tax=unclassified Serratia (in: enterobacteria) TaxID=2647522 RepID=UPI001E55D2FC|nr:MULTISPECIES: hypothetical protein [unclassified Serratia (in: enterobacteria)]
MCGIAGWATFNRNFHASRSELEAMAATMALRGPDASGIMMDRHAGLSHRRLAIVDLEGGVQPMTANLPGAAWRFLTAVKSITLKNYAEN